MLRIVAPARSTKCAPRSAARRLANDLDDLAQPRPRDEEQSGDKHRHRKPEHAEADPGDLADNRAGRLQQRRPEPLHRRLEVDRGEGPGRMDLLADHRPLPDRLRRPRHRHRLVLEVGDQLQRRICDVDRDGPERDDDDREAQQRDQGSRQPAAAPEQPPQCRKGRIERHCEDDGPDDHDEERGEQRQGQVGEEADDDQLDEQVSEPCVEGLAVDDPARPWVRVDRSA